VNKEAESRIKIKKFLEDSSERFFDSEIGSVSVFLENNIKLTKKSFTEFGEDFEKCKNGFIDFLLIR
jgi:type I restriction enzyme R subunit